MKNSMVECTYVHVMSNLINTSVVEKVHFLNDSHLKPLHQSKCCEDLIDDRSDTPIFVLEDKYREKNLILRYALREFFGGLCHVEYVYKINPC